jgi:Ser/Thr protein kinase RdoA (MazF antagonist)
MKAYAELNYLGQVRRLRQLAHAALRQYGVTDARMQLVQHGENTTFRVDTPAAISGTASDVFIANRYLLRIHRPGYQTADSIASELNWLAALRSDLALPVPEPVPDTGGEPMVTAEVSGVPEVRVCTLLRWMRGRRAITDVRADHFVAMGTLMAHLHAHASRWTLPATFTRRHWDWNGLFGDNAGFHLNGEQVWALLPSTYADLFEPVAARLRNLMKVWGKSPDRFGLIHADLSIGDGGNVLFLGRQARAIDFDDCGFGYWLYDFATALTHWQLHERWPTFRDALISGYTAVRPFSGRQLAQLDLFMAARQISEILWATDMAQINPRFAQGLDKWMAWTGDHVRRFLDSHA